MIKAVLYKPNGAIHSVYTVGSEEEIKISSKDMDLPYLIVDDEIGLQTHYVHNKQLVRMPPSPSAEHAFDYETKKWVLNLDDLRRRKKDSLQYDYEEAVASGFLVGGRTYASTKDAQEYIQLAITMQHEPATVLMQDGTCSVVHGEQLKEIGAAMLQHLSDCIQRRSDAVAAVDNARSVNDLEKVTF